ncbi:hypothetical protein WDA79_09150 [Streptomyces sp. A475]
MATTLDSLFLGAVVPLKKAAAYGQGDLFAGRRQRGGRRRFLPSR